MAINNPELGWWEAYADVTVDVYGLIGGAWTLMGTRTVSMYETYGSGGMKTLSGYDQITVTTSAQVEAFKLVPTSGGSVTSGNCNWTSQTTSGSRSATPNGETIMSTVRPS